MVNLQMKLVYQVWSGFKFMVSSNPVEYIDIGVFPNLKDIVGTCFINGKNMHIELKKPSNTKIIATIKHEYTSFRKEIGRLLKEKNVEKEDTKNILHMVDYNHHIIYKDTEITNKVDESDQSDQSDQKTETKIVNVSECIKLHSERVQVTGNIVGITEPFKMVSAIFQNCRCGESTKIFNPPLYSLTEGDNKCSKCGDSYKRDKDTIGYRNAITVYLQDNEKFNDIEKITCILLDIDAEDIRIGERVKVTGYIHVRPKFNKGSLVPKVFSEQLEYVNKEQITTNDKDIEAIKRFAWLKGNLVIDGLVDLFDKSIIGNNIAKEALLYGLVSAGNDLQEIKKNRTRNRLNVLLAGNPGLGKSSLLKKAVSLIQNGRYESVQHSTAKSLTAIVSKEDEQITLRIGPIPAGKGSVCGLNEIGTMTDEDQNHLLDIMEEGEFTINKHGFHSKILSPTAIFATSNLTSQFNGSYEFDAQPFQYPLPIQRQLLDRFDLIVILKDNGDEEASDEYAERKTELQSSIIPKYNIFLQRYLEYARKIKPKISPEANKMIKQYYINLNKSPNLNSESKRKLETIIRICKAVCKLKLKDTLESEDVIHATRFYNAIIYNYNGSKATIPRDPTKMTVEKCIAYLKEKKEIPILFTDLIRQSCTESEYIKSYLLGPSKEIEECNLSQENNKKVRRIKEILSNEKNVMVVNKSPIKLQFNENDEEKQYLSGSDRSDRSDSKSFETNKTPKSNLDDFGFPTPI